MNTRKTEEGSVLFEHATPVRDEIATKLLEILEKEESVETKYSTIAELIFQATQAREVIILPSYNEVCDEVDSEPQVEESIPTLVKIEEKVEEKV